MPIPFSLRSDHNILPPVFQEKHLKTMLENTGGSACTQHRCDGIAEFFPFGIEADFYYHIIDLKEVRISDGGKVILHTLRDRFCPVNLNIPNIDQFRRIAGFNIDAT